MTATAHTGVALGARLCTPSEGEHGTEFVSLEWTDEDLLKGEGESHSRAMRVYLERGDVESLRNLLNDQLAKMKE